MNRIKVLILLNPLIVPAGILGTARHYCGMLASPSLFFSIGYFSNINFNHVYVILFTAAWMVISLLAVEMKNGSAMLYSTLPLTRNDVVKNTYLSSACLALFWSFGLLPICLLFISMPGIRFTCIAVFMTCFVIMSALFPIFFRRRSSAWSFMPAFLVAGSFAGIFQALEPHVRSADASAPAIVSLLMFCAGLVFIYPSYLLSCRFYQKRDL